MQVGVTGEPYCSAVHGRCLSTATIARTVVELCVRWSASLLTGLWYQHEKRNEAAGGECTASVQRNSQHSAAVQSWQWVNIHQCTRTSDSDRDSVDSTLHFLWRLSIVNFGLSCLLLTVLCHLHYVFQHVSSAEHSNRCTPVCPSLCLSVCRVV